MEAQSERHYARSLSNEDHASTRNHPNVLEPVSPRDSIRRLDNGREDVKGYERIRVVDRRIF